MTSGRRRQIEDHYHAALKHDAGRREQFLREACAGDDQLHREVESLLAQQAATEEFLATPARVMAAGDHPPLPILES